MLVYFKIKNGVAPMLLALLEAGKGVSLSDVVKTGLVIGVWKAAWEVRGDKCLSFSTLLL